MHSTVVIRTRHVTGSESLQGVPGLQCLISTKRDSRKGQLVTWRQDDGCPSLTDLHGDQSFARDALDNVLLRNVGPDIHVDVTLTGITYVSIDADLVHPLKQQ